MTTMGKKISCAVIGEGNLLLCCLKDIIDNDLCINVVFTNTESAQQFCANNDIPHYKRNANLVEILTQYETDFLFSISNPRILKEDVLQIPKVLTINYHDSPLPAYAGVHATSWAIINGEKQYGISWHVVETGIDTGDILQYQSVDILHHDSAFTLNLKCVEAAKSAFKWLLIDITTGTLKHSKQADFGRSYFGLHALPPSVGLLNFSNNAEKIHNLARGLEFGNHENALGSPKIRTRNGVFFLVTNASISESFSQSSAKDAGKIIDRVDDTLVVGTSTVPLQISVANLDGSTLPDGTFREHDLVVGNRLTTSFEVNRDEEAVVAIRKKESFWRKELLQYEPTMFYRQKMNVVAGVIDVSSKASIRSEKLLLPRPTSKSWNAEYLQACFVAFLARINCTDTVSVGIVANKDAVPGNVQKLYTPITPATIRLEHNDSVTNVVDSAMQSLKTRRDARTFLVDMFYRYPELRGHKRTPHHNIVIGSKTEEFDEQVTEILGDCNVLLMFQDGCSEVEVIYHERPAQDYSHITDVLQHFSTFLNAVNSCDKDTTLRYIPMVSKNEMNRFYAPQLSVTIEDVETEKLSDLIKTQCRLTPFSIALKTTKQMMTYKRLSEEIDTFSEMLAASCCLDKAEKNLIAIHLPNSIAYVVSLLTLASKKIAYMPLPVDCPADRLVFTLKDAKVRRLIMLKDNLDKSNLNGLTSHMHVVLTHEILDETLVVVEFDKDVMKMDVNENIISKYNESKECNVDKDFAYLMYTSGSTGRPKGVKVKESGVINLARAQITCWDIGPGDVIAQFASIGFDASVSEIYTCLLSGASLAVLDATERLGKDFIEAMNKMKVSVVTLTPSALNIYSPAEFPYLKKVVTAGEACTLSSAVKWTSTENVRFFNAYGPTETTVCATCYEYLPGTMYEDVNRELPIGKAIDGVSVYLFDDFRNPVPPDVIGEIYIGGKGLAHGYIGHAAHFNQEKFIRNPLGEDCGLLYRTGDHAFQDLDGNITYVGRTDDQVKIRGHRIDLSEIEQVLIQHPMVEMAVVTVHKCAKSNEQSIVAFIAPTFIYVSELREYLSKVLPRYMIPTYIKKLEVKDLPKTLNGKINRKQLERDESIHDHVESEDNSHLNDTQLLVANLWCKVFRLDESFVYTLHRQSSFSELGGNSLQLVLLLREIEGLLNIDVSFTDLGTADTIEEFADVIRRRRDLKTKAKHCDKKSREDLREMIFNDSELDISLFPNHKRRRSVQYTQLNSVIRTSHPKKGPKNILISGVTGFLGAFLLSELMEQTDAHVCCMVRESAEVRGMGRIIDNMRKYGLWKFEYLSRIAVVISDLSQRNMGIAPDIYRSLCNAVDVVFMNAAMMNFNTPYEDHRVANVLGTTEFIKFAATGTQKYLFTTSSLSVFLFPPDVVVNGSQRRICSESEFFDDPLMIEGGYGQSKWASERLVMQALDFLPGGAIFRPARVSGRSTDGVGPKNDLFASTMIGMKRLGAYPDMDFPYDLTPVDFCAKSMVEIALKICNSGPNVHERVYHLFNRDTLPFRDLFHGMGLKPMSLSDWRQLLRQADEIQKELLPLIPFFMSQFWDKAPDWPVFHTKNVDTETSDDVKELMKPTKELLEIYKQFFGV